MDLWRGVGASEKGVSGRWGRVKDLAVELLRACGMIRRSEKRSLIGLEAVGIGTPVSSSYSAAAAESLPETSGFSLAYLVRTKLCVSEKSVLPLVNPF